MPVAFECPTCRMVLSAREDHVGRSGRCAVCGAGVTVREPGAEPVPPLGGTAVSGGGGRDEALPWFEDDFQEGPTGPATCATCGRPLRGRACACCDAERAQAQARLGSRQERGARLRAERVQGGPTRAERGPVEIPWMVKLGAGVVVAVVLIIMLRSFYGGIYEQEPGVGVPAISRLREGMTPADVEALLGPQEFAHAALRTGREWRLDRRDQAKRMCYFREGSLLLAFGENDRLSEVAVGETKPERLRRLDGATGLVWQQFPATGFVHEDVTRESEGEGKGE